MTPVPTREVVAHNHLGQRIQNGLSEQVVMDISAHQSGLPSGWTLTSGTLETFDWADPAFVFTADASGDILLQLWPEEIEIDGAVRRLRLELYNLRWRNAGGADCRLELVNKTNYAGAWFALASNTDSNLAMFPGTSSVNVADFGCGRITNEDRPRNYAFEIDRVHLGAVERNYLVPYMDGQVLTQYHAAAASMHIDHPLGAYIRCSDLGNSATRALAFSRARLVAELTSPAL